MEASEGRVKRLRNLPAFKDKTDDELREYLLNKKPKVKKVKVVAPLEIEEVVIDPDPEYSKRYAQKLKQLQEEYGVDMNDSNDIENLRIFVRLSIQLEDINLRVRSTTDDRQLKNLIDSQTSLVRSSAELQDKLGITRKVRKERQVDDIPQYLKAIRAKATDFWNRKTAPVVCPNCNTELARYWLNFPDLALKVAFELECWNCHEKVVYTN